jgi:protein-disulfide isomerase
MRISLGVFLGACLIGTAATAADPAPAFTPVQRDAIVNILRQALKSDPSILRDAIGALQADEEAQEKTRIRALAVDAHDPTAGNPMGDVTVVEFYDPRCPYCRTMHQTVEKLLGQDHGVRLVFKDIPVLGPASELETRAILAARNQGGYLKMQAALMGDASQPTLDSIRKTAAGLGLDAGKLAADMNEPALRKQIDANLHLARQLHVQGTPVFFIGDQVIPGAVDQAELEAAVVEARKHPT